MINFHIKLWLPLTFVVLIIANRIFFLRFEEWTYSFFSPASLVLILTALGIGWAVDKKISTENKAIQAAQARLLETLQEKEISEQNYCNFLTYAPDAVLIQREGKIMFANQNALQLYEAKHLDELVEKNGMDFIHPDDRQFLLQKIIEDTGKPFYHPLETIELKIITCNGNVKHTEASASPIVYNEQPSMLVVIRDITIRKAAEKKLLAAYTELEWNHVELEAQKVELEAQKEQLEELNNEILVYQEELQNTFKDLENMKLALDQSSIFAITNERGIITYTNDKFCEISKYTREELIGNTHRIINSGHHPASFFADMWETIRKGQIWRGEVRNRAKDGKEYWVDTTIVPIVSERDSSVQYMAIRNDITARKEHEVKLSELNERLQHLAQIDGLTGIGNRRYFDEKLMTAWKQATTDQKPISAILLDVDHFKLFNDYYGHQVGDECLKKVAESVKLSMLSPHDIPARYGGEEFVVLLPELDEEGAYQVAERIRNAIRSMSIPHEKSLIDNVVTCSLGLATIYPKPEQIPKELIEFADKALYQSKREGRNRVSIYRTNKDEIFSVEVKENDPLQLTTLVDGYVSFLHSLDRDTWEHSSRVADYTVQLAEKMGYAEEALQDMYLAGQLHDIGKIDIPVSIIKKPTRLTDYEFNMIKKHPVLGFEKISRHSLFKMKPELLNAILHHHERWDGKGYPYGLKGLAIPLSARILAVVDAFDAMTNDRVYKKGLTIEEALREVKKNSGTQFDPEIAEAFLAMMEEIKANGIEKSLSM